MMLAPAALLLVALIDGPLNVPAGRWQAISVVVDALGTQAQIEFEVKSGSAVEVSLMTVAQAARFNRGRTVEPICSSGFREESVLRCAFDEPGQYVLLLDNRINRGTPALVHLRLDLQAPANVIVRELPPERKRLVIALSLIFFGATVVFTARQFLKGN